MADRRTHRRAPAGGNVRRRRGGDGPAARRKRSHRSWASILRGLAWLVGPPVASALLLTLAFPPAEVSWLAYVALAPLLVTAVRAGTGKDVFWAAYLGGLVFFGINLYWIAPISWPGTLAGWAVLTAYLGLYWAVWAVLVRWFGRRLRAPLAVAAPVAWVALEWVRGWLLTGLPWLFVGHTQYENLVLIQTADALGAYGPSALCLATTGLVAGVLVRPIVLPGGGRQDVPRGGALDSPRAGDGAAGQETRRAMGAVSGVADGSSRDRRSRLKTGGAGRRFSRVLLANLVVVVVAWAGTVGYGWYRLGQAPEGGGPVVASVQTCVPQEIKLKARLEQIEQLEEEMLQTQLDLTDEALARAEARGLDVDLVVWPETMAPGILNREYLEADVERLIDDVGLRRAFHYLQNRSRGYWLRVREKAREAEAPILFGAHAVELRGAYRLPGGGYFTRGPRFNTAFLLSPTSEPYKADHRYAKAHLVPFGEYVPFKKSWPWFHERLQAFTPYDYDHSLTPGSHRQEPFVLRYRQGEGAPGAGRAARFQVAICYEDALAYRIREMVRPTPDAGPASREPERAGGASASRERERAGEQPAPKAVDFIVNISNDGWFNGSWELDQHLNLCVFRAVENRVPVVRSVNTGISAIIQSTGRITAVVQEDGERRGVAGCIVGRLALDDRLAPYTRHGDAFAWGCLLATAGLAAAAVVGRLHARRGRGPRGTGPRRSSPSGKEQTT